MKKAKTFIKNNIKLLIGLIIGIIISAGGVYAAIVIQGTSVGYTDNYKLVATTVQAAIDALYNKTKLGNDSKFIEAYTYNASTCVTGNESTCVATACYMTKSANSCPAGTIIRYKVRPGEVVTFHEMYDDTYTITMQAQKNTVYNTSWITLADYNTALPATGTKVYSTLGPLTILPALESATAGWEYVNDQTYTMGTTVFKTNKWTGCSAYNTCATNTYTLANRTAKARMITLQEAALLGCTSSNKSCPNWMNNYLKQSTSYGGTVNDTSIGPNGATNNGYWTMSANSSNTGHAWYVYAGGNVSSSKVDLADYPAAGARAVVVVSK